MSKDGTTGEVSDQQKLARALETISEVLVGKKLESVRGSVSTLDGRLSQSLETIRKDTTEAIERMTKQLSTRVDELQSKLDAAEERQKAKLGDAEERVRKSQEALKREMQDAQTQAEGRLRTAREQIEKALAGKEEGLKKELDSLSAGLSGLQLELHGQMDATERISQMMKSVATVFGGQSAAQPVAAPQPVASLAESEETLDNAVDNMFGGEGPSGAQPDRDVQARPESSKKSRK